ncbi:LL-diaminopimelate aminotransferase, chloroplastic, partial [Tanacetum coccineum]
MRASRIKSVLGHQFKNVLGYQFKIILGHQFKTIIGHAVNELNLCVVISAAYKTQVSRNGNIAKLLAGLFPEIGRRKAAHMLKYPYAKVINLGIGDTTEPIPEVITSTMSK